MALPIPEEVYISQTETLPRRQVAQCARHGCRRCGGQGWFRFAGTRAAWICPCAQAGVRERITQARASATKLKPGEVLGRAVAEMLELGVQPAVLLCSEGVREELGAVGKWFVVSTAPKVMFRDDGSGVPVVSTKLEVFSDPNAPEPFMRVFTAEEFKPYLGVLSAQAKLQIEAARRELTAKAELDQARAELVKPP